MQIVSWNDFGECHYIGPIFESGITNAPDADATAYVKEYPHEAWLQTLPYQIAAYKHSIKPSNPLPTVTKDKIVYWYRTSPAAAGTTTATGNAAVSRINVGGYQKAYPVQEMFEDRIYAIVMLSQIASVSITVGENLPTVFTELKPGLSFVSRPFDGQAGAVTVSSSSGCYSTGAVIVKEPPSAIANFNAWVGQAETRHSTPI